MLLCFSISIISIILTFERRISERKFHDYSFLFKPFSANLNCFWKAQKKEKENGKFGFLKNFNAK